MGILDMMKERLGKMPQPSGARLTPYQFRFAYMVSMLIQFAGENGYTVTFGSAWSQPGNKPAHRANSLHFDRLAVDLNLFKGGEWLQKTEDHRPLGEFWESIGGAWGGRFDDGNHYSLAYQGRK